ncbi:MAG: helix-turn-helix domain-containing protein [Alphaproteobacteria bacterium]|uniref:hypothetical protein n=1 Tax=Brevundimonas sp. TaxID=1871086 RepID=UPI0035679B7D|nr:helix-turn-helix domain-containing protein [Alphaproteobacteria bacterium]MBU2165030.1 helix-turn-helix domain-containing protein [Alphaproteobacteria bacterium]MBU2231686.1 helix-turn-helix domain-containing protein [Alphaproteobacteria bacterium]
MSDYFPPSHLEDEHFQASEATVITNVNPPVQRVWRRRGLLPKSDGWAMFSPWQLLQMSLREVMREMGMPHVDILVNIDPIVLQAQAWAATYPSSINYMDGLDPELHPRKSFIDPPRSRYAWARTPWDDSFDLKLATDLKSLGEILAEDDRELSNGIALIDLKALGLGVAERAGTALWNVRAGPGDHDIGLALTAASKGDKAAQEAVEAIGYEWDASKL